MQAEVSQRGQVTIPKTVREKYGLMHGSKVDVVELEGSIMIVPRDTRESVNRMHENFDRMREELAAADVTLDDMLAALNKVREARG